MSKSRILMYRLASVASHLGPHVCQPIRFVASFDLANDGQLVLNVVDKETGQPLPCRIHLKNASGRPVRVPHTVAWGDHFYCDGKVTLKLPIGNYSFLVERGLEYLEIKGQFRLETFADDVKTIEVVAGFATWQRKVGTPATSMSAPEQGSGSADAGRRSACNSADIVRP